MNGTKLTGTIGHINKELEKEYLEDLDHYDEGMGIHSTSYAKCKERLIRLAEIDNSNPSEALKSFDKIYNTINLNWKRDYLRVDIDIYNRSDCSDGKEMMECLDTIKQALLKSQEQEKVLDILFKKNVDILELRILIEHHNDKDVLNLYNSERGKGLQLTQEEFDLLKRCFNE